MSEGKENSLVIGTRGSALALWQANYVQRALERGGHAVRLVEIATTGDKILDVPLAKIGDKGLFTKELDVALLAAQIDLAVHSLKDLPTRLPEGIRLGAVSEREEPWDAFVPHPRFGGRMEELPEGSVIGTSSLRRQAQLKAWRPDLQIVSVRGNVGTRLEKLDAGDWHGVILAAAGLIRLGLESRIGERVDTRIMLPAVSQGALGIVCREEDEETCDILRRALHDDATATAVTAERAFLRRLEGGCQIPIGAHARLEAGALVLEGVVAAVDGSRLLRERIPGDPAEPERLGIALAERLIGLGADEILRAIRL